MSGDDDKHFSPEKIFIWLFIFTTLEVAWGYLGAWMDWGRFLLWGGLMFYAFLKGWLILSYFMHFRFEGMIVKGLVLPTPFLIAYIMLILNPDVGNNAKMDFPVGSKLDTTELLEIDDQEVPNPTYNVVIQEMHLHDGKGGGGH